MIFPVEVKQMKCEYDDGYKVDYSGSLRITKAEGVNLFVKKRFIPAIVKGALQTAARHNNCVELRKAAWNLIDDIRGVWERK
jgi:hypothetical protein